MILFCQEINDIYKMESFQSILWSLAQAMLELRRRSKKDNLLYVH